MELVNGKKITELRNLKGWGQNDLAKAAKVSRSVISRIERGIQGEFQLSVIISIASALDTSIDSLLAKSLQKEMGDIMSELQDVFILLSHHPAQVQRQAAGILRGYLSTLEDE